MSDSSYETLYVVGRSDWRAWLEDNFENRTEIWLIYPKKVTGKPRIEYNTAVEEALCFGWIDSINKSLDDDHTMQKFSVRNPKSTYSQPNKERLRWLYDNGKIHASQVENVKGILGEEFVFPEDIISVLREDALVWENYSRLSDSYKRIRIAFIDSARKRPEEFEKRLSNFISKTKDGKLIKGFGGIEKYY